MHVYDDGLDVLTNQPPFPWHTENVRNYMHIETAHPEPVAWTRDTLRAFGSGAGMIGFPGGYDPAQPLRAGRLPECALSRRRGGGRQCDAPVPHA